MLRTGSQPVDRAGLMTLSALFAGAAIIMFGGFLDDRYQLKPIQQFLFQLLATVLVLLGGVKIQFVTNHAGGVFAFSAATGTVIAFFWLLGMMYKIGRA